MAYLDRSGEINDDKPRVVLGEHKITTVKIMESNENTFCHLYFQNLPTEPTVFTETFTIKNFKKKCKIVIVRNENYELEFDIIGIHPAIANTFRRLMLSDVPSMAIEKVLIQSNTSIIQDEVLAHRLGLVPLKADPRLFEFRES